MLPKKNKLPIQELPLKGFKLFKSYNLTLKVFSSKLSLPRFGVVVSKKISKSAVERNELKRLVFNLIKPLLPNLSNKDYLIIINKYPQQDQLKAELNQLLKSL